MKIGDLVKFSGYQETDARRVVGIVVPRPAYLHTGWCGTILVLWNNGEKTYCGKSKLEVIK